MARHDDDYRFGDGSHRDQGQDRDYMSRGRSRRHSPGGDDDNHESFGDARYGGQDSSRGDRDGRSGGFGGRHRDSYSGAGSGYGEGGGYGGMPGYGGRGGSEGFDGEGVMGGRYGSERGQSGGGYGSIGERMDGQRGRSIGGQGMGRGGSRFGSGSSGMAGGALSGAMSDRGGYRSQGRYTDDDESGMRAGYGMGSGEDRGGLARGKGPKGYTRSDERIKEEVCDCLTDDPHLDAGEIEVQVKSGEVTLSGTVSDRPSKRHAEDLIEHLSGVKHVQNNLRVKEQQPEGSSGQQGSTGKGSGTLSSVPSS